MPFLWRWAALAAAVAVACTFESTAMGVAPRPPNSPCWPYDKCPSFPLPFNGSGYPDKYDYSGKFPDGFLWGLGTAAYQIEGGYNEDGRGASIWDTYTGANTVGMPGSVCHSAPCPVNDKMYAVGATGNVANNHYHNWKRDVALMKSLGVQVYRFSLSWPRLVPLGNASAPGGVNEKAVAWYNELIDELLANNITPAVTLYHWDLPQALLQPPYDTPDKMGWFASDSDGSPNGVDSIVANFNAYADLCYREFGDRVKLWFTFNEAWTFTMMGSGGNKAPGLPQFSESPKWPLVAGHNVLLAHAAAVQTYRNRYQAMQGGKIGITNNMDWREPLTTSPADVAAAERSLEFQLGWFAEPIFGEHGDYPASMRTILGSALPTFTPAQSAMLKGSSDVFGLNHYGTAWVQDSAEPQSCNCYAKLSEGAGPDGPAFPRAQSSWLYGAGWGIRKIVNWVARRYGKDIPIMMTEGGWSVAANTSAMGVTDPGRTYYYANYTSELQRAISEDGINVQGYLAWSLMDNFEWERGFTERFGTVFNDFHFGVDPNAPKGWAQQPTASGQVRTPKDSVRWLGEVWKANAVVDPTQVLRSATAEQ